MAEHVNGDTHAAGAGKAGPSRRRRPRPTEPPPTHGDILEAVDRVSGRQDEAERHVDLMAMTVQRIEKAVVEGLAQLHVEVSGIRDSIGVEGQDQYGKPIGTGVVGRLMRLERRNGRWDGWLKWASGAAAAVAVIAGIVGPILWWLIENRVEFLR